RFVALIVFLDISSLFFPVGRRLLLGRYLLTPPNLDAFELKVTPGDITVARGSDVTIQAVAMGFDPQRAEVHLRYANSTQWEIATMEGAPQNVPTIRHQAFNLKEAVHYLVDARGNRS